MFGNQWDGSVLSFKILSVSIVFQMVLSSSGTIFQATNETKKLFYSGILGAISNCMMIIIGILYGKIEYVAVGVDLAYAINFFTGYYLLIKKVFLKKLSGFFMEFKSIIIIILISSFTMMIFRINIENYIISALYKFVVCALGYLVALCVTKDIMLFISILGLDKIKYLRNN